MCFSLQTMQQERLARERSEKIDLELEEDGLVAAKTVKILLLGCPESGKSTVLKQLSNHLEIADVEGFASDDLTRNCYSSHVQVHVVNKLMDILKDMQTEGVRFDNEKRELDAKVVFDVNSHWSESLTSFSVELLRAMQRLWEDSGVQSYFIKSNAFGENYSTKYLLDDLDRIAAEDYQPTTEDILHTKLHRDADAVVEFNCSFKNLNFKFVEIGGQRSEHKWIHHFENFTAVIFCVAISDYDKMTKDQNGIVTNKLQQSLKQFESICNSEWFRDTNIIVFLNKIDIFEAKLESIPLSVCFPDYTGGNSHDEAAPYVQAQFEAKNVSINREIYTHLICAISEGPSIPNLIFETVTDIILASTLRSEKLR